MQNFNLKRIDNFTWEIPRTYREDMKTEARFFASERMKEQILKDKSLEQLVNVTTLPGIVGKVLAMPDIHQGYGFCIGAVAATDIGQGGVISPGGIGFDINCGVRLLVTNLYRKDIEQYLEKLATAIYERVPSGLGRGGEIGLSYQQLDKVLREGSRWIVEQGYGTKDDLQHCESEGRLAGADPAAVSQRAKVRGQNQLGTLGAGNHFLEIQEVGEIFDRKTAQVFGLETGQITIMIHCGSRGLGHQVCADFLKKMIEKISAENKTLPDLELVYEPFNSSLGQEYFAAMKAAANFAWANRQIITVNIRRAFKEVLGSRVSLKLLYDVAHNIAKVEKHEVQAGIEKKVILHRKGATRAFGPGRKEIPADYRQAGQPVLIPGSMGTASFVLVGTKIAEQKSFASTCHGAGRIMSRTKAVRNIKAGDIIANLQNRGIILKAGSKRGICEEAPQAYKDIEEVVQVVTKVGISKKVAKLLPLVVIKG